jgi:phosphocarrier protein HPr
MTVDSKSTLRRVTIRNVLGLHARPAAQFVQIAARYPDSEVTVRKGEEVVNGKSIMGMMMLAAGMGTELEIEAINGQHGEAVERLCELIENKFGEE